MNWPDDPKKDYRKRYRLPEHWVLRDDSPFAVDYVGYIQAVVSLVPEAHPLPDGDAPRALDAGCGDGFVARRLVDGGYRVVGVDYSDRAIGFARVFVPEATFHCHDLREVDQIPDLRVQFDLVTAVEVIEHLPAENQLLVCRHLAACLKPGGNLIVSVPSLHIRPSYTHYKHFSLPEVQDLLTKAGFRPETVVYQNRLSLLNSRRFWGMFCNRWYDLVVARRVFKWLFLKHYNLGRSHERVGRYILRCLKPAAV